MPVGSSVRRARSIVASHVPRGQCPATEPGACGACQPRAAVSTPRRVVTCSQAPRPHGKFHPRASVKPRRLRPFTQVLRFGPPHQFEVPRSCSAFGGEWGEGEADRRYALSGKARYERVILRWDRVAGRFTIGERTAAKKESRVHFLERCSRWTPVCAAQPSTGDTRNSHGGHRGDERPRCRRERHA